MKTKLDVGRFHAYQGDTNDCGPCSASIVANAIRDTRIWTPEQIATQMTGRLRGGATPPWTLTRWFREHMFQARWGRRTPFELTRDLQAGVVGIIVCVGDPLRFHRLRYMGWMHWKVVAGRGNDFWSFSDPALPRGSGGTLSESGISVESGLDFLRDWERVGRMTVEVWR